MANEITGAGVPRLLEQLDELVHQAFGLRLPSITTGEHLVDDLDVLLGAVRQSRRSTEATDDDDVAAVSLSNPLRAGRRRKAMRHGRPARPSADDIKANTERILRRT